MTGATEMREEDRLDMMLQRKANEGVQICVLIWNETKVAVNLNSQHSQQYLENLHPSIKIIRHPLVAPVKWSHHQKILVVDQDYAVRRSTPFPACVRGTHVRVWRAVAVRNAVRGRIGLGDGAVGRSIPSHHRLAAALQVARQGTSHTRRSRRWTIT
jgi:hypothetical protein